MRARGRRRLPRLPVAFDEVSTSPAASLAQLSIPGTHAEEIVLGMKSLSVDTLRASEIRATALSGRSLQTAVMGRRAQPGGADIGAGAPDLSARLRTLVHGGFRALCRVDASDLRLPGFRFHHERELLSIGYRVADGSLEPNYYDLLASEARLASFVAIAKGEFRPAIGSGSGAP